MRRKILKSLQKVFTSVFVLGYVSSLATPALAISPFPFQNSSPLITFANNIDTPPMSPDTVNIVVTDIDDNANSHTFRYIFVSKTTDCTIYNWNWLWPWSYYKYTSGEDFSIEIDNSNKDKYICAYASDNYTSTVALSNKLVKDTQAPTGNILINADSAYTNSRTVALTLSATDSSIVSKMKISNDSSFSGAKWKDYSPTKSWELSNGDGVKTVYVMYKDNNGNVSSIYNDTITLDTSIPEGSLIINNNSIYTNTKAVTLTITPVSEDINEMMISNDSAFAGAEWELKALTKVWTLNDGDGEKAVYIKFRDSAFNESTPSLDTIILDTTAPTTPQNLKFLNPNLPCGSYTTLGTVTIDWEDSTDAISSIDGYEYSIIYPLNGTRKTWSTFFKTSQYRGTLNQGLHEIRVRAKDNAGNLSEWSTVGDLKTCNITYDNILPSVPVNGTPNGALIATNNFDFNWDDSIDASPVTYIFQSTKNPAQVEGVLTTDLWVSSSLPTSMIHSSGASDGTWYWQVKAIDDAGNTSAWSTIWTVTIDTEKPAKPLLVSPTNNSYLRGETLTNVWSDTSSDVSYYIYESYNNQELTSLRWRQNYTTTSKTATNVADTTFWWRVRAVDLAGNESDWSEAWKITIDNINPIATITNPTSEFVKGTVEIKGTFNDVNPLRYYLVIKDSENKIVGGPGTVYADTPFTDITLMNWDTTSIPDGTYTIILETRDKALNKGTESINQVQVTVDNTGPILGINSFGLLKSGSFDITGTASDSISDISNISLDFGDGTTCSALYSLGLWTSTINNGMCDLKDGKYDFEVTATDNNSNYSKATYTGLVIDNEKPQAQVLGTTSFTVGDTTQRSLSLTDNNELDQACYSIDSTGFICTPTSGTLYSWDISSLINTLNEGSHTFVYYVVDRAGNRSDANNLVIGDDTYTADINVVAKLVAQDTTGQVQGVSTRRTTQAQTTSNITEENKDEEESVTTTENSNTEKEVLGIQDINTNNTEPTETKTSYLWIYIIGGFALITLLYLLFVRRKKEHTI